MAEKIISPGVFTSENDLSFLPTGIGEIGAAIIGPTTKGPVEQPTLVTSYSDYTSIFGDTTNDKHMFTGSVDVTGSYKLNGYQVDEISNDTSLGDSSTTSLPTENASKGYLTTLNVPNKLAYLRKSFAHTASISNTATASFNAITASAPSGVTTTSEEDFMFFVIGMLIEGDALTIQQKTSTNLELRLNTSGLGYSLESGDEVVGFGKFNS